MGAFQDLGLVHGRREAEGAAGSGVVRGGGAGGAEAPTLLRFAHGVPAPAPEAAGWGATPYAKVAAVPRSQRNDNFIDKSFTVMADLIVKLLPIDAKAKEAYVYYRDGLSAQNDGDYAEALDNYGEALKLEENKTDRAEILKNMAIIFMSNGEEEKALDYYRQSLEENSNSPSCFKNMGLIYEKWGRIAQEEGNQDEADRWFDQAAEHWTKAVRLYPGGYLDIENWLKSSGRANVDVYF
jgi:tetratricopeptide (TPR) repeat protein